MNLIEVAKQVGVIEYHAQHRDGDAAEMHLYRLYEQFAKFVAEQGGELGEMAAMILTADEVVAECQAHQYD